MGAALSQNLCSRCGKVRILVSTHTEVVGNSTIVINENSCPDPDCQAKLDRVLEREQLKRFAFKDKEEKRKAEKEMEKKTSKALNK